MSDSSYQMQTHSRVVLGLLLVESSNHLIFPQSRSLFINHQKVSPHSQLLKPSRAASPWLEGDLAEGHLNRVDVCCRVKLSFLLKGRGTEHNTTPPAQPTTIYGRMWDWHHAESRRNVSMFDRNAQRRCSGHFSELTDSVLSPECQ